MYLSKQDAVKLITDIKNEFAQKQNYTHAVQSIEKIVERMGTEQIDEWSLLVIFRHLLNIAIENTELNERRESHGSQENS